MNTVELEHTILGGVLIDPSKLMEIEITPDDFLFADNGIIYQAIMSMSNDGEAIDMITVAARLETETKRDWFVILGKIAGSVVSTHNLKHYAELLRTGATRRKAIEIAERLMADIKSDTGAVDKAIRDLMEINSTKKDHECSLESATILAIDEIDRVFNSTDELSGIATGLKDFDECLGGLHRSDLIVIGARPAMGKTAFMLNIANKATASVGIISGEQPREQVAARSISINGKVSAHRLRVAKRLTDMDWPRITAGVSSIQSKRVRIYDKPAPTVDDVVRQARKWKQQRGLEILLVDYLQRLKAPGGTKREQVGYAAQTMKELARELDIPVVVLSQVNRAVEGRSNQRPMNSDLKEAGDIEQEADVIAMLYRDEVYNEDSPDKGIAEIIFTKNRHGPIGTVRTTWLAEYMAFENMQYNSYD